MNPQFPPELLQRRQEYEEKAHRAALNIRHAVNKDLAIRTFLRYLTLSIDPAAEASQCKDG